MSKYVKNLIADHISSRLEGVNDALVVDVIGLDSNSTVALRKEFREKNCELMVVKNSLAKRATEGTPLGAAFEGVEGSAAVLWGSEDIVSLAKALVEITKKNEYEDVRTHGGVMDGGHMSAEMVKEVSKWPSREEQLSLLMGQVLSPGATLVGQLAAAGANLASQIKQHSEREEGGAEA